MRRRLWYAVFVSCLFAVIRTGAAAAAPYDFGNKDMVLNAGAQTVTPPKRSNTEYINPTWELTQPWVLSHEDTEYVLMNDVVADGTAFIITGSNITLNLNGH
ncbi:MAG TPA: hypothetical protein VF790_00510, partial [Dissulfurispiraceae bacterium]